MHIVQDMVLCCVFQLPPPVKFNCVSLRQFRLYTRHAGQSALQLVESSDLSTRTLLSGVDPYANLTIGVSLVNSAGLESYIEQTHYVGSKNFLTDRMLSLPQNSRNICQSIDSPKYTMHSRFLYAL